MKKVEKITGLFRYVLNQVPCNYTVVVTNRFKGLDLRDRVPEDLWMEVKDIVQEAVTRSSPRKRNAKLAKWLSEEASQIAEKRREAKGKGEKEKIYPFECIVPKTARRTNQFIQKEINPKYSLEELMLKLKLQYFGHLMQRDYSLEKRSEEHTSELQSP